MSGTSFPDADLSSVELLAAESRRYGADPSLVIAGGGNTSWKSADSLYVKASGRALATIDVDGFVRMERRKLNPLWDRPYPEDRDEREAAVLADMLTARAPGEEDKRPSVETLLHELFPDPWVFHMHPTVVNALTCAVRGRETAEELFGDDILWIPPIEPGLILARRIRLDARAHEKAIGRFPRIVFLENHGVFVSGDKPEEIRTVYDRLLDRIAGLMPSPAGDGSVWDDGLFADIWRRASGEDLTVLSWTDGDIRRLSWTPREFSVIERAPTPDHIVYSGHRALYAASPEDLPEALASFRRKEGTSPRIVVVRDRGFLAGHPSEGKAEKARDLFRDQVKIAIGAEAFGGMKPLPPELTDFILNWEVERFRASGNGG